MAKGIRPIGVGAMLLGCALPLPAWAGSAQAALTVAVVVPARCAIRVPGSLTAQDSLAGGTRETIAMRCTKGSLPGAPGQASGSVAGPRIRRDVVTTAPLPITSASRQAEAGATTVTEAAGSRIVVTVNF